MAEITESANVVSNRRVLLLQRIEERRRASSEQEPKIPRRKMSGDCPLSYAQELMWLLDRLNADGVTAYNSIWTGRLRGPLNTGALQQSLNTIIERHEILRTVYITVDGVPAQRVTDNKLHDLGLIDLAHLQEAQRELEAVRILEEEVRRPFDLSRDLMMRVTLVRMGEQDHLFLLDMHHIAIDGWAKEIIYRELSALYEAFCAGKSPSLSELPIQYADFALWQRDWITGQVLEEQLAHWVRRLSGAPPLLELPTDYPRAAVQMFRGNHERSVFPASLAQGLKALAQKEGATLFMTLMAAFQSLLHRYAGRDDMLVATVVANRPRPELENLVGYFSNSLVLRTDCSGDPSFRDLLHRVRDVALDAYDYQDLPFEKLVVELKPDRDLSYSPLFQVMFNLQNHEREQIRLNGLTITELKTERGSSKFDLTLNISEKTDGLRVAFEYNTDLFKRDTIRRMLGHFQVLLEGATRNPAERISRLPLLTPAERRQIVVEWNETRADYDKDQCIHQLFEAQVKKTPDAIALVWGNHHLTYAELDRRANQLAHHLRKHGAGPETRVVICVERSVEMVLGVLGILKAGAAYVPVDAQYAKERLPVIMQDAEPALLLTQQHVPSANLGDAHIKTVRLDSDWPIISEESTAAPATQGTPQNLAYVIYTSGSTGKPKGVMITHASLRNAYMAWEGAYGLQSAVSSHLQMANFSFDVFTGDLVRALCSGGKLVLCPLDVLLDPAQLYELMVKQNIDCAEFVPSVLRNLLRYLKQSGQTLDFMRVLISGSDTWHVEEHLAIEGICGPQTRVLNSYGVAEATIDSCYYERKGVAELSSDGIVPIGRPFHNTRLYILDRNLQPVPVGVPGELYIAGNGLARGYLNNESLTSKKFLPETFFSEPGGRMYKTGDTARYLADGNIEFLGRTDHQIKIRGFRVELGEIEVVLSQHNDVEQAVVLARKQSDGENQLVAYVVAKEQHVADKNDIRKFLKERLPAYMVPSALLILPAFPLSMNGKIDRSALPAPENGAQEPGVHSRDTREQHPTEEVIAGIWTEVLKLDQVGVADDFFDLGGHSLLATQVVSRIRQAFQVELPLRALFEAPTVSGLALRVELLQRQEQGLKAPPLKPAGRNRALPLSFAQQRLWFLDQLEPDNSLYNMPHIVRMTGALNTGALEKSLNEIVRRHEALRTSFQTVNNEPLQVIASGLTLPLAITDLSSMGESEREAEARKLTIEEIKRPFDLRRGPMLRASLLKLTEQDHVLVLNTHHIVGDRWSLGVLSQELATLYEAFAQGKSSPLPELPIQYADYAIWQRQFLTGEVLEKQLTYWKQQLQGAPQVLEIPTDRPRPPRESFRGDVKTIPISAATTEKLKKLSRQEGVTLFMTLLAAWQVLLGRYSGQDDLVVGTPIANRLGSEIEGLIGFFANILALRCDLSGNPTFRVLLSRVREVALGAYSHQDLPFEKLVEELRPERSLSHNPLFQVLFALQNTPALDQEIQGLKFHALGAKMGTAKCDLTLFMTEGPQGLIGRLGYNTDIFDESTIDRLASHFQILLEGVVADPERTIGDLPLLSQLECDQLLKKWNATEADYPRSQCLHQLFETQVESTPNALALYCDGQSLTYRELNEQANRLAHHLEKRGVGPGSLIGVYIQRSLAMMVALLAVQKAGAAYVPIDPAYPSDRIAFMLEDSQAPLLLTEKSLLNSLPPHAGEALCLDGDAAGWAQESGANPKSNVTGEDLLYVIFTSGSTGKPKGVQVQHRAVVNLLTFMARELRMGERDVVPALASFAFDMCIPELYLALVTGGRVVIGQRDLAANGGQLAALLRQTGATLVHATPTTWSLLLEAGFTGKGLKRVIGAEPLSAELCTRLLDADLSLYNFYGPTETTVWSTFHQFRSKAEPLTVGRPLANTQVYILDKNLHPVPIGVPGEIHIGGDGVACGYLKRPQLTAEKFVADPFSAKAHAKLYKTGDVGRYFPDGRVEFLGRIDTQVKLRGYRIELGEIEAALTKHPSLQAAAVVVREDTIGDKRLVAYVIPVPEQYPTASELRAYLKQSLPEYMVPSAFTVLDKFPLTANGKLDRHALPAPDVARQAPVMSPRDEVESMLLEIWRKVLNVQRIGVQDSFFELGGHSLLAVRLMTEIEKATGKPIPLATLFQEDTVEHLAEIIRRETRPPHQIVSMIQPGNSRPAFFAIVTPGANPLGYVALARHLAQDQPFYSIQGPGPRLTGRPYSSAEFLNLANRYIEAMRTIQPHGPYYLGGMCEGARIAFDMARVLDARGEDVALLAIFDTWVIENTQIRFLWKIDYYRGRFKDFWRASLPEKRKTILKWLRDRVDHRVSGNNRSRSEWPAAYWPGASFVPPTFGGGITLLKRPKQPFYYVNDPQMGWGARTTGNVELQVIDVNTKKHILLLREPYVSQLAEKLMESLRSACERNSNNVSATAASR